MEHTEVVLKEEVATVISSDPSCNILVSENESVSSVNLSKTQLKRIAKEQLRKEKWQEKRKHEKEKHKEKKRKMKEDGIITVKKDPEAKRRKNREEHEITYAGSVVIDCGFDKDMTEKEVRALASQLGYSYAANVKAEHPFHLYYTSFGGKLEVALNSFVGHDRWKVSFERKGYEEVFDPSSLVYLTSDSPNVLHEIDPSKVYIIGGIVDHNRLKGVTYQKAQTHQIVTAQLPIEEHMKLSGRKVLTVNQVLEILVSYVECKDWKLTLDKVVPLRRKQNTQIAENTEKEEQHLSTIL